MSDTLTFKVTADDIRYSTKQDPCNCAIAKALKRKYPSEIVVVDYWLNHYARVHIGAAEYKAGADVADWLVRFDEGRRVNPRIITLTQIGAHE